MSPGRSKKYREFRLSIPQTDVDLISDYIVENITGGMVLEEEEGRDEVSVIFYLDQESTIDPETSLRSFLARQYGNEGRPVPDFTIRTIKDIEWIEQYRRSVIPVSVGEDIVVRPPWCERCSVTYDLIIEPRMAFGTGTHGSTSGCLQAIRKYLKPGARFLDLGCGSGILSILADKMGAAYIKAVDYDKEAVENSLENFKVNDVTCQHEILLGSLEQCDGDSPYEFVCANIIRSTILEMHDRLLQLTAPGGNLVLSGLLERDLAEIRNATSRHKCRELTPIKVGDWHTLVVTRP